MGWSVTLIRYQLLVLVIWTITISSFVKPSSSSSQSQNNNNNTDSSFDSLDSFIHENVNNKTSSLDRVMPRTGVVYYLTLPLNLSAIHVSFIRLRSGSLWMRGQNISTFHIPPMVVPEHYVKRIVLVTSNLGNMSSHYFPPPEGYALSSPVFGMATYNASATELLSNTSIAIEATGEPIIVTFDNNLGLIRNANMSNAKCLVFGRGVLAGKVVNMTGPSECSVFGQGYVGIIVPVSVSYPAPEQRRLQHKWWLVAGCVGGIFVVIMTLILTGVLVWGLVKRRRFLEMQKQSENDVSLGTMWIGPSRMPVVQMCRTQPRLEDEEMLP